MSTDHHYSNYFGTQPCSRTKQRVDCPLLSTVFFLFPRSTHMHVHSKKNSEYFDFIIICSNSLCMLEHMSPSYNKNDKSLVLLGNTAILASLTLLAIIDKSLMLENLAIKIGKTTCLTLLANIELNPC